MRFLLNTIGSAGDVHPFIAVGVALKRRGHDVTLLANPHFADRIHRVGLGFRPLGSEDDYARAITAPDLVHRRRGPGHVLRELMLPAFQPTLDAIADILRTERPDAVLAHHICLAMPAACQRAGIPCATAVLSPLFWLSRHEPIVYPTLPIEDLPAWTDRLLRRVMRLYARFVFDRPVNHARRRAGLHPIRNLVYNEARGRMIPRSRRDPAAPDRPVLALWSPHYRPALPDDPASGRICGFAWFDRAAAPDPDIDQALKDFLAAGPPPVVFTLGTSVVHHAGDFYHLAAEACAAIGRRAILLVGGTSSAAAARPWPAHTLALAYAPFSRVFPHAACNVHHGGIGTTAHAMRAGVPQLIIPFANDEFDNAARARRIGVAHTLKRPRLTARSLAAALEAALADKPMAAASAIMGRKLIAEDGAETAAEVLMMLAARGFVESLRAATPARSAPAARR